MKQLVFIIESLNLGGAEKSLVTLLQNIDYTKYKVDLIIFNEGGVFQKYVPKQVKLLLIDFYELNFFERVKFKLRRLINLKNRHSAQLLWPIIQSKFGVLSKKYDVAIAYNQGFATYFTKHFITAQTKFAWINTDYKKAGYQITFDYEFYKNYDHIVAVSLEAKMSFENQLETINKKLLIEVIKDISDPKIIDLKSLELIDTKFDKNKINIVTVGRLAKQKSLHLAIESCYSLIKKGYSLHWYIVGEGSERAYLEKIIAKKNLKNYLTLIGQTDNPYPYIKLCDIYVQTSSYEGLGLTVIEAAILKKPIVCTNFSTSYSIIEDNVTGLISEMNTESLVSKIELLINNESLKKLLVENLSNKNSNDDHHESLKKFERLIELSDNH